MPGKDRIIQPAALAQSASHRIRWHACEAICNEDIPPFALMQLKKPADINATWSIDADADDWFVQDVDAGELIWLVSKCDADGESRQNPAEFVFNGPDPIRRRGLNSDRLRSRGRCHQDYPAQVLHNGALDGLPNFRKCGPARNTWQVWSGGSAFTNICHDITEPVGDGAMHTVWVARGSGRAGGHAKISLAGGTIAAGAYLTFPSLSAVSNLADRVGLVGSNALQVTRSGVWKFGFQAKVSAGASVPRGSPLLIRLYRVNESGSAEATIWAGERDQDIEEDQYGNQVQYTAENVAFTGIENLESGEGLKIRNDSNYAVTLSRASFWLSHDAEYFHTSTTPLSTGLSFP